MLPAEVSPLQRPRTKQHKIPRSQIQHCVSRRKWYQIRGTRGKNLGLEVRAFWVMVMAVFLMGISSVTQILYPKHVEK